MDSPKTDIEVFSLFCRKNRPNELYPNLDTFFEKN